MYRKTHNKRLTTIKPNWLGNPKDAKGRYMNADGPSEKSLREVLQWQRNRKAAVSAKRGQHSNVKVVRDAKFLQSESDGITWLGHCTFWIRLAGKNIITDPVLYNVSVKKRWTPLPCAVHELKNIDYILLSHNHRDHCDRKSLLRLCKQNPKATILTSVGLEPKLRNWRIANKIQDAGWWQRYDTNGTTLSIDYLPAKHWSRRAVTDTNTMLWGSFMIQSPQCNIYFGADSGLGNHFQDIGKHYEKIDYAMIGIGAYEPKWFMSASHTSPTDAVEACTMLGAKKMIPMHYGTFDLSDEPMQQPLLELQAMQLPHAMPLSIGEKMEL